MAVLVHLEQVMEQHNLYKFGVESQMAKDCGFHRHTVGKLLRNQVQTSKLEVLEKICGWLIERGVPAETLPSALFGIKPSGLWRAMGHSKKILNRKREIIIESNILIESTSL